MTDRSVSEDSVEALRHAQSSVILAALDDFLRNSPNREVRLTYSPIDGFHVELREAHESRGESLRDAAAQAAQILVMQTDFGAGEVQP